MKTYLELEGKLGNQSCNNIFLPNKNSSPRKTPVPKKAEKKKRAKAPVKRRFKVRMVAQPMLTNPTLPNNPTLPAEPTPTVVTSMVTTQTPLAKSAVVTATSIPISVYHLAQGKFKGIPCPTRMFKEGEGSSAPSCNNPQEDQQPEAAVTAIAPQNRENAPWPNTMPASTNLFDARAPWPILPTETPTVIKMEKVGEKIPPRVAAIPCALVLNKPQSSKPAEEECRWGPHCPICTKSTPNQKAESIEGWNGERQDNQQRNYYPQSLQYSPAYEIPDRFSQQYKLEMEWNERMECLKDKYNLDYYSSSESNSESQHKYETII